ncbi:MAG: DUF4175 family protein [Desulfobacterales bacterium]|nr:MAG: DUF4175 family protein [Desulfobacterales bacterium]
MLPDADFATYFGRLERFLKGILLRLKLLAALEFCFRLATVFLIVLLGSLFAQAAQDIFAYLPFAYYLLALVSLVLILLLGLLRIACRISLPKVARGLEEKLPGLKDDVTNALLLYRQIKNSGESDATSLKLVEAHLKETVREVSRIDPNQVVNFKRLWPHLRMLLPLVFAFAVVSTWNPQFPRHSLSLILDPSSALPDRRTFISVEPTPPIVLRGTPVAIKATLSGRVPDEVALNLWQENGESIRLGMTDEGGGHFSHRIPSAQRSFRYQVVSGRTRSAEYVVSVVEAPDIGKLVLTLIPPAYTRLPKDVKIQGHIEALKGTIVNLAAWTTKPVTEAKLILNNKTHQVLALEGDRLTGNLLVLHPGTYSISVKDALGFENPNPVPYSIHLIPDKYPEAQIVSPPGDVVIAGRESLPLVYEGKDDFGLTSIRLIYQVRGKERIITLQNPEERRSVGPERFRWDLSRLALIPGDRVAYRLEVWDNDSISGPKAGYSRTLILQTKDEKGDAAQEAERAGRIADLLLDLLADQLEAVKDRQELAEEISRIMEMVDRQLGWTGMEKLERLDLQSLRRNMATLYQRIEALPRETITRELERLALLAEDIAKRTRMHEVEALAREINNRHRRLIETLKDGKDVLSSEALRELLNEIDRLKELISQVMEALSRMADQLPDDFINSPELSELDFQDLFKDLAQIQEKLLAGDRDGALEAAQRLLQTLSQMMAAMASAGVRANTGAFDRLQSEMSQQAGELDNILAEQKKILSETELVDQELQHAMEQETQNRIKEMMPRLKESLAQLKQQLSSEETDQVSAMENLLDERQIVKLLQLLENLETSLSERSNVQPLIEELGKLTKRLHPDQHEIITEDSRAAFPDLSARQEKLQQKTQGIGQTLEMLSQLFPGMDTQIINDINDAAGSMARAAGRLKGEDADGAIPPEREAIQRLSRSQQGMQQMAQQMAQRMRASQQSSLWGYDHRAGWYYGPWAPMPTLPQPEVNRAMERGFTGIDREEFDPPDKDTYKAPKILREKVMEALKDDIPPQYRREVEKYFKELTQ